ncbi:WG repeat-containing protein [Flavobacterium sp. LS1R49]|uniref:WG repeat-containing protein n=1 Tax=Flavobacterium shii TaxID=2987687 RepID=A0A9X3C594_9FLAO|nr:WG repeat-containing protein [Flavobacterium shii]MCV9926622.1 WG repeat-containing protein [Flavobacterium shii]
MIKYIYLLILTFTVNSVCAQNKSELDIIRHRGKGLGYALKNGTIIVKPQFSSASYDIDGYYIVSKIDSLNNTRYALLNREGKYIINLENSFDFFYVKNGKIVVKKNNYYGIINDDNEIIVPIKYNEIRLESEGFIIAMQNKKYGVLDYKNNILVPFLYDFISDFSTVHNNGKRYAVVEINGKNGVIDDSNNYLIKPTKTIEMSEVVNNSIIVTKNHKWGLIDFSMRTILPIVYDSLKHYRLQAYLHAKKDEYYYHFTLDGKLIKKYSFENKKKSLID